MIASVCMKGYVDGIWKRERYEHLVVGHGKGCIWCSSSLVVVFLVSSEFKE